MLRNRPGPFPDSGRGATEDRRDEDTERPELIRPSPRRERKKLAVLTALLVLAVLVGVLAAMEIRNRGTASIGGYAVANYRARATVENAPAPDFTAPSLADASPIRLSSFRGSVVIVNFWASWCAPCRLEAPGLRSASKRYLRRGVTFLGVDYQDDDDAGRAFMSEFGLAYPSVTDHSGRLAYRFDVIGFPTTLVIDGRGRIRYRFVGYLSQRVLERAVEDVLSSDAS
jgi:DsbE subfamily thiol:disulfide oxidoreductase